MPLTSVFLCATRPHRKGNTSREKLKFSKTEIEKLPPVLQKLLEKCGRNVACRTTEHGLYQARFRRNGYNVEVADKNFSALKEKFLQKLIAADNKKRQSEFPLFKDYAEDWLSVKRRVVKDSTYDGYALQLRRKLIPEFGDLPLNKVQRSAVQNYLFSFSDAGKHRTAYKLKTLLSAIFATAAEDFPALLNPMRKIVSERYSAKKGKAFTVQEERKIIEFCSARQEKNEHTSKACGAICVCARPLSYCYAESCISNRKFSSVTVTSYTMLASDLFGCLNLYSFKLYIQTV